ncbi:MAG TPA: hypothetical protein VN924_23070 [Bryobacteraceae bacterium]|nr:hypothetical protein [Bryobacteraceae bacterium]
MKFLPAEDRSQLDMVMEWVDGRLLRQILNERGKFPPSGRCALRSRYTAVDSCTAI